MSRLLENGLGAGGTDVDTGVGPVGRGTARFAGVAVAAVLGRPPPRPPAPRRLPAHLHPVDLGLHGSDLRLAGLGVHRGPHLFCQLDFFLPKHDLVSVKRRRGQARAGEFEEISSGSLAELWELRAHPPWEVGVGQG